MVIGSNKPIDVDGPYPLLGDHSRSGIEKVDPRFVGTQARLCKSIQFLDLAEDIEPGILTGQSSSPRQISQSKLELAPRPRSSRPLTVLLARPLLRIWRMLPGGVRIAAYEMLRKLGRYQYGGPADYSNAQRLPFGLYLKSQGEPDDVYNEFNALKVIHKHTSIPAPEPLDVVVGKADASDPWDSAGAYLLISRVPGEPLSRCQDVMADRDFEHIAYQIKDYLSQLRDIPKDMNSGDNAICNTLGKACRDPRIHGGEPVGPFVDEAAFSQDLRFSDDPARRGHKIVFTHADLNPRNILVQRNGRGGWEVSGIVDWETSGYYPEYWDYTKALFEGFRWPLRYSDWVTRVFAEFGDYSREHDVESKAWEIGDGL